MSELDLVRLDPGLPPPDRAHPDDAGLDLRTTTDVRIEPGERVLVGTGVAIALPPGHVGLVCARSGLAVRDGIGLVNAPGVVDAGYRGEIRVCLVNHDRHRAVDLHRGDRVAQLLVQRVELPAVRVVEALPSTARGTNGFGSTGSGDDLRDLRPFTSREGHGQGIEYGADTADGQFDAGPGRPHSAVDDEGALRAVVATEPARGRHRKSRIAQVPGHGDPAGRQHHQHHGPWDGENAPRDGRLRLDLGSVQLPVPPNATLIAEPDPSGPLRAVHVMVPEGRLTVSAFAAPRTGGLWGELVEELATQLQNEGATIRRDRGEWGRELVARNGDVVARVVAVEGPRWLLRGVGTGPAQHALTLHGMLRDMVRSTVVARSPDPLPVRSLLPLEVPDDVPEPFRDTLYQTLPTRPRQIAGQDGPVIPMMLPQKADSGTSPGRS